MADKTLFISGVPAACNAVKVKLFFRPHFEGAIKNLTVKDDITEVTFSSCKDAESFAKLLPMQFPFGGKEHQLTLQKNADEKLEENNLAVNSTSLELFDKKYSWHDLDELPNFKKGLLVRLKNDPPYEHIKTYFKDESLSFGGDIKLMIQMFDGILIFFRNESIVERVWQHRPHRIDGRPVRVFVKQVPPHVAKVFIKVQDKQYSEKSIQNDLEIMTPSDSPAKPKSVTKLAPGQFFVDYSSSADLKAVHTMVKDVLAASSEKFQIIHLVETDCIKVMGLPPILTRDEIKILFENKHRCSGGPVTCVQAINKTSALVYFAFHKDATEVIHKFEKDGITLFGYTLTISPYYSFLEISDDTGQNISLNGNDETPKTQKTFTYKEIPVDMLDFLHQKPKHMTILKRLMEPADIKLQKDGLKVLLNKKTRSADECQNELEKFFCQYTCQKLEKFDEKDLNEIRDAFLDYRFDKRYNGDEDILARWTGENRYQFMCVGLKEDVESLTSSMEESLDRKTMRMVIEPSKFKYLLIFKAIARLSKIKVDLNKSEIQFTDDSRESRRVITDVIMKIHCQEYQAETSEIQQYLKKTSDDVQRYIQSEISPQDQHALFVIQGGQVTLCGSFADIKKAKNILDSQLVQKKIPVKLPDFCKNQEVKQCFNEMISKGWIAARFEEEMVTLVGFKQQVTKAMELLNGFSSTSVGTKEDFSSDVNIKEESIMMSSIKARYLVTKSKEMKTFCQEKGIKFLHLNKSGIVIRGEESKIREASNKVKLMEIRLIESIKYLNRYGAVQFFTSKQGQDILDKLESQSRSLIMVQKEEQSSERQLEMIPKSSAPMFPKVTAESMAQQPCKGRIGTVELILKQGDITLENADTVVNSTSTFSLRNGGSLSRTILDKAGQSLQAEVDQKQGTCIRVTSSGKLPCKRIFHVITPFTTIDIGERIKDILDECAKKTKSLVLPVIGTGVHNLPNPEIAYLMLSAIASHTEKSQSEYLKSITIVFIETFRMHDFKVALSKFKGTSDASRSSRFPIQTQPNRTNASSMQFGLLTVSTREGDITAEANDAIINSTGDGFDLSYGQVSKAILKRGGYSIQQQVDKLKNQFIRVTDAGNLPCRKIIHVVTPRDERILIDFILKVFETAEHERLHSISLPALGAGNIGLSLGTVGEIFCRALTKYSEMQVQQPYLRNVNIVIFDKIQLHNFNKGFLTPQSGNQNVFKRAFNTISHELGKITGNSSQRDQPKMVKYDQRNSVDRLMVTLCSASETDNDTLWREFLREVKDHFTEDICVIPHGSKLTQKLMNHLLSIGKKFEVFVKAGDSDDVITVEGLKSGVSPALSEIAQALSQLHLPEGHSSWV